MTHPKKILQLLFCGILLAAMICCGKSASRLDHETTPDPFSTASEMVMAIQQGKITSVELLDLHLGRIQRYNNAINAVVALDVDAARNRAEAADKAIAEGKTWGPLHGLPMTVKDVFEVEGMPATSGDPKLKDYFPNRNAVAVQRLIDAGAIIFGKTNVPYHALDFQSYNSLYGTTAVPIGFGDSGLPVGIQIIGPESEDRTTIDFAKGLSELLGGFKAPPNYMD